MTVPIIPGPFQFLAEAGQAAGQVGIEAEKLAELRRKRGEARYNFLLDLVEKHGFPTEILTHPEAMDAFKDAFGKGTKAPTPPATLGSETRLAQEKAAKEIPLVPLEAETQKKVLTTTGAKAESEGRLIPDAEVLARTKAKAETMGAQLDEDLFNRAYEVLGKNPLMADLAAVMAIPGMAQYEIAKIQHDAQRRSILNQVIGQAGAIYKQKHQEWANRMEFDPDIQHRKKGALEAFKLRDPEPTPQDAIGEAAAAYGMPQSELQELLRGAVGASVALPKGKGGKTKELPPTLTSQQKLGADYLSDSTKNLGDRIRDFFETYSTHVYTAEDVKTIFRRMEADLPAAEYDAIRKAFNEAALNAGNREVVIE